MRGVEGVLQLFHPRVVDLAGGDVEADLVALAGIAAVGEPADEPPLLRHLVGVELRDRVRGELREARREPLAVEGLQRVALRRDVLVLQVGREQAGRRRDPGMRRYNDAVPRARAAG